MYVYEGESGRSIGPFGGRGVEGGRCTTYYDLTNRVECRPDKIIGLTDCTEDFAVYIYLHTYIADGNYQRVTAHHRQSVFMTGTIE